MAITAGVGAAVSAGTGLLSGILGGGAAKKAASQQAQALQQGIGYEEGQVNQAQANLSPWITTGQNALQSLASFFGLGGGGPGQSGPQAIYNQFTNTPFYQFPLKQGIQARDQSAAARGLDLSGGQEEAIGAYGSNYASQNFASYLSGLSGLASGGQTAANQSGTLGVDAGKAIMTGYGNLGTAQASGTTGAANALTKGLSFIPQLFSGLSQVGGSLFGSSYGGASASPAVNPNAPDYTGGATANQLQLLGLPSSGFGSGDGTLA